MRFAMVLFLMVVAGCGGGAFPGTPSLIVVANRGDGTISIIDSDSLTVVETIPLPPGGSTPRPGYVTYSASRDRLYVGDEANQRVVVLSGSDYAHLNDLPALGDVFHIWQDDVQLWAVDRTNRGVAVFDLDSDTLITFIPIPADLAAAGGVPHDVVVQGGQAFVSILGVAAAPDAVVRYSTATLAETGRMAVGEDPHLFLHPTTSRIYVACQDSDAVYVFDSDTLAAGPVITVDGGHGVWIPPHGQTLYVTNFAGHEVGPPVPLGAFALFSISLATNRVFDATHAPRAAPHNIASNAQGTRLFVTHSDGGTSVTVYTARTPRDPPRAFVSVTVGVNPFGICRMR